MTLLVGVRGRIYVVAAAEVFQCGDCPFGFYMEKEKRKTIIPRSHSTLLRSCSLSPTLTPRLCPTTILLKQTPRFSILLSPHCLLLFDADKGEYGNIHEVFV